MRKTYRDLLDPSVIHSISGLALISKVLVQGYLHGAHASSHVGTGMEFSQYRSYQPGDDLRLLDWKMLARSGKYFVKQSEIQSNINVSFIIDASESMLHSEDGLSKLDYTRVLAASLAHLAHQQGDAVGLLALNDNGLYRLLPKKQQQHFHRFLHELIQIEGKGKWPNNALATEQLHDRRQKELLFFITDMYEHSQELFQFVKRLKTLHNEVVVLHIMGKKEMEFDYKGNLTFQDLETGTKLKVTTSEAKETYLSALDTQLEVTKDQLLSERINYHLFQMGDPLENVLQEFLTQRKKLL